MNSIEKLIEIITNKKKYTSKSCDDEISELNMLSFEEGDRENPDGNFNYLYYYLDYNFNLETILQFYCRYNY
jgi:hypothetical protein